MPIVTAYASLGKDGLLHSLNQTEAKAIFTDAALLGTLKDILPTLSELNYIVYYGKPKGSIIEEISSMSCVLFDGVGQLDMEAQGL